MELAQQPCNLRHGGAMENVARRQIAKMTPAAAHALRCDIGQMARDIERLAAKHRVAPSTVAKFAVLLAREGWR